jgi:hypothetical protein
MRSCMLLPGAALSLAALAPPAAADWHWVEFPGKGKLGVIGGKAWVVARVETRPHDDFDWSLFRGGKTEIRVLQPEEWQGRRLAYDPEGKDKAVFLARKPGPGQDWTITPLRGEQGAHYTIQAAEGKLKGWYLDVAERPEQVTDAQGRRYTAYRAFLSEKPKRLPKVLIEVIAP